MQMKAQYVAAAVMIISVIWSMLALGEEVGQLQLKSLVDRNYRKTYVYYHRIYAPEKRQVRDFYMNRVMASAVGKGAVPSGAVIVLEVYGAKVDSDGRPLLDGNGQMMPGPLNVVATMETIDGARRYFRSDISNGDWVYFF
jgi:hypothetical protein